VGYQPEERYWTDYLRIALPVVGLLLMLGLFWFWAASLIGDEDDDDPGNVAANTPVPTAVAMVAVGVSTEVPGGQPAANDNAETATTPPEGEGNVTAGEDPGVAGEGTDVTVPAGDGDATDEDTPADNASDCEPGNFCEGELAVVNSDGVNLRSEPTTEGGEDTVLDQLSLGDEVTIIGEPQESDDRIWVEVDSDVGEGFVTTDFLEQE